MTSLNVCKENGCYRSRSPNSVVIERKKALKTAPAKFWLEEALHGAVETMIVEKVYAGKIMQHNKEIFCVQENDNQLIVPRYISSMKSYTECDCRLLFRNIAENVRVLHNQDVVHRRLNVDNLHVDQSVRKIFQINIKSEAFPIELINTQCLNF
jgi:serine/threonine protein kinase